MHIIYVHQYFKTPEQVGGTRSYEMAKRMVHAGHQVSMICGTSDTMGIKGKTGSILRSQVEGIDIYRIIEPYSNNMSFARRWIAFLRFAKQSLKAAKTLRDVDLVFATSTPLTVGAPGRKAAKFHHCPFVFEVRDLWPERAITLGVLKSRLLIYYLRRMEYRAYHAAQHIITLAPRMSEGVIETGYPASQVTMIPNSCDVGLFVPKTNRDDIEYNLHYGKPGDFRLVHAGANGLVNGIGLALDAVKILKQRAITGVRFVFIGPGSQTPMLKTRCDAEGLNDYISWIDPLSKNEIARILPQMDVGMMLCKDNPGIHYGTSPNKFFDYLSSGIPVLINYPGWLSECLEKNECGVTVTPEAAEDFADAVVEMMNQREKLKKMGMNARKLAEEVFSRDELGAKFVQVMENVVSEYSHK